MPLNRLHLRKLTILEQLFFSANLIYLFIFSLYRLIEVSSQLKSITSGNSNAAFKFSRDETELEWNSFIRQILTSKGIIYLALTCLIDFFAKNFCKQVNNISHF